MKKNKKKLSIFKRIGLIAIALFSALGSLFIPFASKKQNNFASADDSSQLGYLYNSSSINFILEDQNLSTNSLFCLNFKFSISPISGGWNINVADSLLSSLSLGNEISGSPVYTGYDSSSSSAFLPYAGLGLLKLYSRSNSAFYVNYTHNNVTDEFGTHYFNCNVQYITLYSGVGSSSGTHSNYLALYDNYGASLTFEIVIPEDYIYTAFSYRTYFTANALDVSDSDIFNQGYQQGLADNQQNIYDNGFSAGKISGESIGYDKGVLEANNYSFKSLFGAVIDAPIQAFSGLFNFEFLGVNLLDFFLGILTFGVIVFVIKLLLGGK